MVKIQEKQHPSPLTGYESLPPLTDERTEDGKSLVNPRREDGGLGPAYERFVDPLDNTKRGGFDVHVYYNQNDEEQTNYARALWERIRREFPELRIYPLWDRPVGPHPIAMFEVDLLTPQQFGAFVPWLAIWRGPLSVLVHPNTIPQDGESINEAEIRNHSERAIWMGQKLALNLHFLAALGSASTQ